MRLKAKDFLSLQDLDLDLDSWPHLTLLLGENGSGKTSIFDLFLWTLTGKTSRGATKDQVIRYGTSSVLGRVDFKDLAVVRSYCNGVDLYIEYPDGAKYRKSTFLETQKYLSSILPSYPEIISTSYISQQSLLFELSDSGRKDILGHLLKLELLTKARELVSKKKNKLLAEATSIATTLNNLVEDVEVVPGLEDQIKELKNSIQQVEKSILELQQDYITYQSAQRRIEKLEKINICPTCLRELTDSEKQKLLEKEYQLLESLEASIKKLEDLKKEKKSMQEKLIELTKESGKISQRLELLDKLNQLEERKKKLDQEVEELQEIETVFSWKGAITLVLEQLTEMLNVRIRQFSSLIYPDAQVKLVPFRKLKSGEVRPSFEISIKQGRITKNYTNLSSGEKKRINLVVLFVLAELFNRTEVLFCDEVFDHLDKAGIESVIEVLNLLEIKNIVVTTHSRDVASHFSYVIEVSKRNGITELYGGVL